MKKSVVFLLHISLWVCHLSLVILVLGILFQGKEDTTTIQRFWEGYFWFALLPSAISFYAGYFLLFVRHIRQRKFIVSVFAGTGVALGCTVATYLVIHTPNAAGIPDNDPLNTFPFAIIFLIALANVVLSYILRGFISWIEEIKLREILTRKNHEIEMALVKAQLDPHFLFNTINNIDALILKDAEAASAYLNKLSDILRFMLYEVKPAAIPLEQEIQYIEKYMALQKLRTTNGNFAQLNVKGQGAGIKIAPLTLLPFVENAFKHATDRKKTGAITIQLEIEPKHLRFTCTNTYDPEKIVADYNGLGNNLIRKRLALVYPEKHSLNVTRDNTHYRTLLAIEL